MEASETDRQLGAALTTVVRAATADRDAVVRSLARLSGGASRETWSLDILHGSGSVRGLILRRDPPGDVRPGGMAREADAMNAAKQEGVAVPGILASGDGSEGIGTPFILMERLDGETLAPRILKRSDLEQARARLATQAGQSLARIHRMDWRSLGLQELRSPLADLRARLDRQLERAQSHPVLELGLQWLADHEPEPVEPTVVHGDFRMGNLMVDAEGLVAVLDWELVHAGDPMEDLGWLCVRAWRFGHTLPVGGFATREALFAAYSRAAVTDVDSERVRWWELYGTISWGLMCTDMAERHLCGDQRSVELAAIGRRVAETEWDVLDMLEASL